MIEASYPHLCCPTQEPPATCGCCALKCGGKTEFCLIQLNKSQDTLLRFNVNVGCRTWLHVERSSASPTRGENSPVPSRLDFWDDMMLTARSSAPTSRPEKARVSCAASAAALCSLRWGCPRNHRLFLLCARSVAQSCPTLCFPLDCGPPGSSVHGILQARTLVWVAISYSGIFPTQGSNPCLFISSIGRQSPYH